MKTALVTGSTGFAGRHYCKALEQAGWNVTRIDLRESAFSSPKDARDFFRLGGTAPSNQSFDLVVHCAAVVGGRDTIDGNPLALASNLELDAGLFQWALRTQPGRVVYVSSSAAYPNVLQGLQDRQKLREEMIDPSFTGTFTGIPDQLYGWAKLTGENLAHRARQEGLNVTVIRPFSGYGPDQDESYPFRAFIERAKRREGPFTVWGSGQQVRDFIHISDIVSATLHLAENGIDGPLNLGTGRAVSMLHLARMVCQAAGYSPKVKTLEDKPSGMSYRVADVTELSKVYTPEISLEQGILEALRAS